MKTFIALLRGINVSGHKIVKMELLRKALAELDFTDISTYIQSGNVLFKSSEDDAAKLETQIASKINEHFGFDVAVVIVTPDYLKSVITKNPYKGRQTLDPTQPYVVFLSGVPTQENIQILESLDFGNDEFVVVDKHIYLLYANSAGNTKLSNATIESKIKLKSTSRNWKTILKLITLSEIP